MATVIARRRFRSISFIRGRNAFETLTLRRFHPRSLLIDMAGNFWIFYFLWIHDAFLAIAAFIFTRVIALTSVWDVDPDAIEKTPLGRIAILHTHPVNVATQLVALLFLIYGFWTHVGSSILFGLTLLCLGHVYGWSKVNPLFAENPYNK